jgi:ankyrin repeat protein
MTTAHAGLLEAMAAFHADDAGAMRAALSRHPDVRARINEPIGPFDAPVVIYVKSRGMLDTLLEAGADINARSQWWAGGFGLLDLASPELAAVAIERGARLDAHSAARLGRAGALRAMLAERPELVHARGGDGQTPLHFAATIEIADLLLSAGADINALDVDHESTPAQYMVGQRQDVARHLVAKGCRTDLLLTAALGDLDRARQHLDANPSSVAIRVNEAWFPKANPKAGGTIYNWTLDFHASAHEVAKRYGHADVLELLFERTPPVARVVEACWLEVEPRVRQYGHAVPDVAASLDHGQRQLLAHAARNNKTTAVRLMLECGLPVSATGQHLGTPLHWAAFHGNADMVREILRFNPSLEATDRDFKATPLGWAIYGSEHGWYVSTGSHAQVVTLLLQAGAKRPDAIGGSAAVREALQHKSG